jgi:hypothetical protein
MLTAKEGLLKEEIKMNKPFHVPMAPEQLPQQRIVEVVTLPPTPPDLEIVTDCRELEDFPISHDQPLTSTFLIALEWAWSPMNNRLQGFSLEAHDDYWLLWSYFVDFVENDYHPWVLTAVSTESGLDERSAAVHLLTAALIEGKEVDYLDRYHWIADSGLITPADMREIGLRVWPEGRERTSGAPEPLVLEDDK